MTDDMRDLVQVYIRDANLNLIGQLTDWVKLECTPTFNGVGAWILDMPRYQVRRLTEGGGIVVKRNDKLLMSGPYTQIIPSKNDQAPSGSLEISGVDDSIYIQDRLVYPDPTQPSTNQAANAYYTNTGAAETVVKALVNLNAGPGAYHSGLDDRRATGLLIASDNALGSTVKASFRFDNLMDAINALLVIDGLGWDVTWQAGQLLFDVIVPRDLSGSIRFTWDGGNMPSQSFILTAPIGTREIVAGSGVGTARVFREKSDPSMESTWNRRIERFNDRRDTADTATLDQAGSEFLIADGPTQQLTTEIIDTESIEYGRDYRLGDKVAMVADVAELDNVVRQVHYTLDAGSETLVPLVGTPNATAAPATAQVLKKVLRSLNEQQRRL